MPLTPSQRKELLGKVRYAEIGAACGRSQGQIANVINDRVRDAVAERGVAEAIGLPAEQVFPRWDAAERRATHVARFWSHVAKTSGCWNWRGAHHERGYGKCRFLDQHVAAHRLSYELANGPIAIGSYVCHTCDNPSCVNPAHLYLGSALTNNHDTRARQRRPRAYKKVESVERSTERRAS